MSVITVSFKIAHDFGVSRTFTVSLAKANSLDNFGTVTAVSSPYTTPAIASNITTPTVVVCQFTLGSTDASNGLLLQINDSSATTVSAKNVLIGDIQLELGSVATPFEQRPYGMELALCQRYYQVLGRAYGFAINATQIYGNAYLPVSMRSLPTLLLLTTIPYGESPPANTGRACVAGVLTTHQTGLSYASFWVAGYNSMTAYTPAFIEALTVSASSEL